VNTGSHATGVPRPPGTAAARADPLTAPVSAGALDRSARRKTLLIQDSTTWRPPEFAAGAAGERPVI
jgi:hypothetical protein